MARTVRGICSSPLSSEGEVDHNTSSHVFLEISPSPVAPRHKARATAGKRKPKAQRVLLQQKKQKKRTRSNASDVISHAPQPFVDFLATQLTISHQTKLEAEWGNGHDYLIQLPLAHEKSLRKQSDMETWIRSLGFTSKAPFQPTVLRISHAKADVILSALKQRTPSLLADSMHPTLVRMNQYYKKLDAQPIDCASPLATYRSLSSMQHRKIAEAMEDVLAQGSVRRDRRVARRLSKLERMTGRLLSSLAKAPSSLSCLPPLKNELEREQKVEKRSLTPMKRRFSHDKKTLALETIEFGQRVLQLVLESGFVDVKAAKETLRKVSKMWETIVVRAHAWNITDYTKKEDFYTTAQIYSRHPYGQYLADGAYKEVYKVFTSEQERLEAISVMDISDIGNQNVIRQEVAHSLLLSDATEHGVCPNFLRVFDVFLAHERPSPDRWGSKAHRKPSEGLVKDSAVCERDQEHEATSEERKQLFQYMRMEYCDGGDLEDFIRLQKNQTLPLESVAVPFFFQMVFSLYCAREKFHLRHCDVKLLNFFLKDIGRPDTGKGQGSDVVLHFMLETACFVLQIPSSFSYWVKLADYGAADSNLENLGKPVTIDQFTTLENSPIEFLLEGDAALQSYAADTFSLGLCMLHLFTGSAPYEEILEDVHCPKDLLKDLKAIWMSSRKTSGYSVIKSVARGDDENTLCHTLYRYVVLFGLPEKQPSKSEKVWQLLLKHLRPQDVAYPRPQRRRRRLEGAASVMTAKEQFDHDRSLYSIAFGSNSTLSQCRDGLERVSGAMDLLTKLMDFNPLKRPTLKQVMYHSMFSSLRSSTTAPADYVVTYYGNRRQGGRILLDV